MANGKCPMCGAGVSVPTNVKQGDIVYCDSCDAELEVVNVKPLELDWPLDDYDYDEDFDEDYDDDDDFDDDDYDDFDDED
jgi:lysine biosynthesis protein LysW